MPLIAKGYSNAGQESKHVGEPGKRQEFILRLERVIRLTQGYYVALYLFSDLEGNSFVWFASKDSNDYEEGLTYRIKASVKAHRTYKGVKQTQILRLKIVGDYFVPFAKPQDELTETEKDVSKLWMSL